MDGEMEGSHDQAVIATTPTAMEVQSTNLTVDEVSGPESRAGLTRTHHTWHCLSFSGRCRDWSWCQRLWQTGRSMTVGDKKPAGAKGFQRKGGSWLDRFMYKYRQMVREQRGGCWCSRWGWPE